MTTVTECDGFRVGDRVVCTTPSPEENDEILVGDIGEIVFIHRYSPHIGVAWNKKTDMGHDCNHHCEHGYGWFVNSYNIEHVEEDELTTADEDELIALFY